MGIREISDRVQAELGNGKSRHTIFQELSSQSPESIGKIAYSIGAIPLESLRRKYLFVNAILCVMLLAYSLLTILSELPIDRDGPTLFIAIETLLPLVFLYFVYKFHGGIYRLVGIWSLFDLLEALLLTGAPDGVNSFRLLVIFSVVVLSFLIARKVFPNLGIVGPKKDSTGSFILEPHQK